MEFAGMLAGRKKLSADDVRELLAEHRQRQGVRDAPARTTTEVVERSRVEAWNELDEWERDLWREYLGKYGHTADVTGADGFHITDDVRLSMALRMVPRYVKPGAREAWDALVNDPVFIGATAFGITAYFALWLAPEPLVTKIGAVATTIGIVTMAGCSVAEIMALGRAWLRLRDEAARARTLIQLEDAAERFGKALGGAALRILLAVATAVSAKVLPTAMPRPLPGGPPPAAALPGGGIFVLGTATPVRTIKIVKGGLAVFMAPPAISTLGKGNKAPRSDASSKPAAAKPGRGKAGQGKAAAAKDTKAKSTSAKGAKARTPASKSGGNKPATVKAGPGQWKRVNESMSKRAARYQQQITGRPAGEVYEVKGVRFDSYRDGKLIEVPDALIEAKGPGYKNFVKDGKFQKWFEKGQQQLMDQAERQFRVARGTRIEWHVADAEVVPVLQQLFADGNIRGITVIHTPFKP